MSTYKRHPAGIARRTSAVMAIDKNKEIRNTYKLLAMGLLFAAVVVTTVRMMPM